MNDCFPDDFGIKKKELSLFDIKTLDSNYIFLEQNRSWDDKMLNSKVEIKKCLRFDRKKGLFDLVEAWAWFDGGVQYSRSEISYLNRKSKAFKSIVRSESRTRDALLRSRINGDSLSQVNQSKIVLLKVGDTMPEFGARVFSSNDSITLRRADTGIVVFDFFYTTCGPCIAAIREINRLDSAFRPKGVRVYGVDPFVSDWKKLEKFMLQHPMNYSVLQTPYETSKLFGVRGYPSLFVVKNGIVIYVTVGYSPNLFTELSKIIESSK
jgi:thiol-disulfide isomerase/thioredoxin